jgi:DNA-binding NarL/FixJ family response regulator
MARSRQASTAHAPLKRRLGVVVVDPLTVVRAGLRLLIDDRPDMEVLADVATAEDGLRAVARTRRSRVVVLVGLGLSGEKDAGWLIRSMRELHPSHPVLGMGANAEPAAISRALFVGADGYVDKNVEPQEFLQALVRVGEGEMVLAVPPSIALGEVVVGIERRRDIDVRLTEREREVLSVAAEGLTARQMADRLGVRERTITTHLARIYGKLGVGNRLAAIHAATRSGLVSVATSE